MHINGMPDKQTHLYSIQECQHIASISKIDMYISKVYIVHFKNWYVHFNSWYCTFHMSEFDSVVIQHGHKIKALLNIALIKIDKTQDNCNS